MDTSNGLYLYDSRTGRIAEDKALTSGCVISARLRRALAVAFEDAKRQEAKAEAEKQAKMEAERQAELRKRMEFEKAELKRNLERLRNPFDKPAPPVLRPVYDQSFHY